MGPDEVVRIFKNGTAEIKNIDGKNSVFLVNGHRLKVYIKPLTKEDLMEQVKKQPEIKMVGGHANLL